MAQKLTKRMIEQIESPSEGVSFVFDTQVPGFGVRTTASGIKSFIWQGRVDGRKQRLTIGRFGALTLEQARAQAKQLAGEVAAGRDPRAERHRRRVENVTLGKAFEDYLQSRGLKSSTVAQIKRVCDSLSGWLSRSVTGISRDMVARRHRQLGARSPAYANLTMRYLRAVLNFASEAYAYPDGRPLLTDNPVKRLSATKSWYRVKPRRTYLAQHELPRWMQAVQQLGEPPERAPGNGKNYPKLRNGDIARDFFMLLILTGLRRSEALNLKWENVNFEGRTLTIPDPKNHEPHTLPLSDYLLCMLKARRKASPSEYVFVDGDGIRFSNLRYAINRVEQESGIRVTCHDLRRTFATVAESLDIPAYAVKALLNHKTSGDVTAGYIQITPERLSAPMQRISDYILRTGGAVPAVEPTRLEVTGNAPTSS